MNLALACWLWLALLMPGWAQSAAQGMGTAAPAPMVLSPDAPPRLIAGHSVYWIDPHSQLGVDDVESAQATLDWRPRLAGAQYDLDGKAMWVRFDATTTDAGSRWFAEVALSGLDLATMYYRDSEGRWVVRKAGSKVAVTDWPLPGRFPTFELSPQAGSAVTYWLRIERSRVAFSAPITLYNHRDLSTSREQEQILLGAYFGLAFFVLVVASISAASWRDRNFTAYALYVGTLAAGQLAYLGVGSLYLWPHWTAWSDVSTYVLPSLSPAAGLWMLRVVTEPARFSRRLDLLCQIFVAVQVVVCMLDGVLATPVTFVMLRAMTLMCLLAAALLLVAVMSRGDDPDIGLIALGLAPVAVAALFPIARSFELLPTSALTRYSLAFAAALEMPILYYALNRRAARRREAVQRKAALARIDALTGLANGEVLAQQLGESISRARRYRHRFGLLVIELGNFAAIQYVHGEAMLERALVVASTHLTALARDTDVAARLEGPRFALLVQGPASDSMLMDTATALVARGLRESRALPPAMSLRFHVALARLPDGEMASQVLMARLYSELERITLDSRKTIRQINF